MKTYQFTFEVFKGDGYTTEDTYIKAENMKEATDAFHKFSSQCKVSYDADGVTLLYAVELEDQDAD